MKIKFEKSLRSNFWHDDDLRISIINAHKLKFNKKNDKKIMQWLYLYASAYWSIEKVILNPNTILEENSGIFRPTIMIHIKETIRRKV